MGDNMRRQEVIDIMEGNGATELHPVFGPDGSFRVVDKEGNPFQIPYERPMTGGVLLWFPVDEGKISMELSPEQVELVG
jgi:hypothetical protein|tara:strand:+ start:7163 stop:7399 length:237 start_codon:yes stop_codon:yes gene_type:complete